MNEPNPDWYGRLSKGPFAAKTVTNRLMAETERKIGRRLSRRGGFKAGAVVGACLLCGMAILTFGLNGWKQPPGTGKDVPEPIPAPSVVRPPTTEPESPPASEEPDADGVYVVRNGSEVGQGPVSRTHTTLGGIRIGDTQEQVRALLGEPGERTIAAGTPYPLWRYPEWDMDVTFYRKAEIEPAGGVLSVSIGARSSQRLTDRVAGGIAAGDGLDRLLELYRPLGGTADDGTERRFWIRGSEPAGNGLYKPVVRIAMKEGRVSGISLDNEGDDPNPTPGTDVINGKPVRARAVSGTGELLVLPDGEETVGLLEAPSCLGREIDYRFAGAYRTYFKGKDGQPAALSDRPIPDLIYPSNESLPFPKLSFDTFEAFYFIPRYADCHGLTFYLYGTDDKGAYPFRFELEDGSVSDTFYVLPGTKPKAENDFLVTYGGGGAGTDGYTRYSFKPDPGGKLMKLVQTDRLKERPKLE
ncbi:hypothetical protein [Paenibacillus flagellatus]|uniref:Uncharacterized protein n=1 Tax=Paenibacillus flagellatus TaxID=2211139 RepID=A0A2V5K415_9BACL|nr:hypothetical protein [Paenibacillus flagellatus]PYI54045.1 hypothetical protein DLM86_16000 [Paenibacillus flagellatus]